MTNCLLVRYAEIGIKGKNRLKFEKRLVENIKKMFAANKTSIEKIIRPRGRIIIFTQHKGSLLKRVFGIANYSPAIQTTIDAGMVEAALKLAELKPGTTFRITCQRLDKNLPFTSNDVARDLGAELVRKTKAKVDLENYDVEIGVELIENKAYVFTERVSCFGGLPVSSQAKLLALIEKPQDELAALLMLKRGCDIIPVCFEKRQLKLLRAFGCFNEIEEICCLEDLEEIAQKQGALGIVLGQTLKQLKQLPTSMMVLRPLVTYDDMKIKVRLNEFRKALQEN